jgi:hypothetical protein
MTDVIGEGFDGAIRIAVQPGASLAVRSFIVHEGEVGEAVIGLEMINAPPA